MRETRDYRQGMFLHVNSHVSFIRLLWDNLGGGVIVLWHANFLGCPYLIRALYLANAINSSFLMKFEPDSCVIGNHRLGFVVN